MKDIEVLELLITQLRSNFALTPDEESVLRTIDIYRGGYESVLKCLTASNNKYFSDMKEINPFNSVMYCNYLYCMSHITYKSGSNNVVADKIYYLNKMLNSVDLFYAIELPEHWSCEHPLGSVMGRAKYGDKFFFYQGCTVGGNHKDYPEIGDNVTMFSNSKILGNCKIGDNVIMAANSYIKDMNVPDNTIVFGQYPNVILKENKNIDKFWK